MSGKESACLLARPQNIIKKKIRGDKKNEKKKNEKKKIFSVFVKKKYEAILNHFFTWLFFTKMSDKHENDDVNYEIISNNHKNKKPRSLSQQKQLDTLNQRKKENMLRRLQQEQEEMEQAQQRKRQAKLKDYEDVVAKQFETFFNKLNEPINSFFNSFEEEYDEEEVRKKPSKKEEKTENIIKEPEKIALPEPVTEPATQPVTEPKVKDEPLPKTNEKPKQDFSSFLQRRNKK